MDQLVIVLLDFDKAHTVPQRTQDCRPGICGLNHQVYGSTITRPLDKLVT